MNFDYRWDRTDQPRRTWHGAHAGRRLARRPRRRFARIQLVTMSLAGIFLGLGWAAWPTLSGDTAVARVEQPVALLDSFPAGTPVRFSLCHSGGGRNCVVDGDTFWMAGTKIRIADIDTPETHPARCTQEAELGAAATRRLHALLNSGPVALETIGRDTDRYGRKLRIVSVDGRGVGETLIAEGLARRYGGGRREGWCG